VITLTDNQHLPSFEKWRTDTTPFEQNFENGQNLSTYPTNIWQARLFGIPYSDLRTCLSQFFPTAPLDSQQTYSVLQGDAISLTTFLHLSSVLKYDIDILFLSSRAEARLWPGGYTLSSRVLVSWSTSILLQAILKATNKGRSCCIQKAITDIWYTVWFTFARCEYQTLMPDLGFNASHFTSSTWTENRAP
jgi:hypothetical protein